MYFVYIVEKKQLLFPYTALIDLFLQLRGCLLRGTN